MANQSNHLPAIMMENPSVDSTIEDPQSILDENQQHDAEYDHSGTGPAFIPNPSENAVVGKCSDTL